MSFYTRQSLLNAARAHFREERAHDASITEVIVEGDFEEFHGLCVMISINPQMATPSGNTSPPPTTTDLGEA